MDCHDVFSIHIYDVVIKMILLRRALCSRARTFSTFVNLAGYVSWWLRGGRRCTHGHSRDHWIRTTILDKKMSREFTWWLRAQFFWLPNVKNLGAQFRRSCTKGICISLYSLVALQSHVLGVSIVLLKIWFRGIRGVLLSLIFLVQFYVLEEWLKRGDPLRWSPVLGKACRDTVCNFL
jgi:hypothetical protein